jgi:rhodanese-related sulfurtransferase
MKILLLITFILAFSIRPEQAQDEYVCTPCGYACDESIHDKPGQCKACGMPYVKKSSIRFTNITVAQLCDRLKANPNAVLLDVRSPGEFDGSNKEVPSFGHFRNAININVTELEKRISELSRYKDEEILVYCSHGHRSPASSYLLGQMGFTNLKNMTGGVSTFSSPSAADCLKTEFVFHDK